MTILVDMDDVIENLHEVWIKFLNSKYCLSVQRSDVRDWDMHLVYPTLTPEQIYEPLQLKSFWNTVEPKEDASQYIQKLIKDGHEVYIVTATHYGTLKIKVECIINRYFPSIPYKNIIVAHRKQMIVGDVLIDDYPQNLIGGHYFGILFDAPYNRNFQNEEHGIVRVNSWKEIYEVLSKFEK